MTYGSNAAILTSNELWTYDVMVTDLVTDLVTNMVTEVVTIVVTDGEGNAI